MHPDSFYRWMQKFTAKNGLPQLSPHMIRHMSATFLLTSGTDLRTVAGWLGHANTNTTTTVYAHLLKSAKNEASNKMDDFIQTTTEKTKEQQKKQAK
jgi:integrase